MPKNINRLITGLLVMVLFTITFMRIGASAADTNLISNPSVENSSGSNPVDWSQDKYGSNTVAFSYKSTEGHIGDKSLYINMSKRSSGDAKWLFPATNIKPNTSYTYSEFYKSNVSTEIDIEYTDSAGKLSYAMLGTVPASQNSWAAKSYTFTTPANAKKITVFHLINKVGWLQTDDFSLTETSAQPTSQPQVSISSPVNNEVISGIKTVTANAVDSIGIAGVQFKLDGNNISVEDTTMPYTFNWDSKSAANGVHLLSAVARNISGVTATATTSISVNNIIPSPPTITFSSPAPNSVVKGNKVSLVASATDTIGIAGVQFKADGNNIGTEDLVAPYSIDWDTSSLANGSHVLTAIARNTSNLTSTATLNVTVQNDITPNPIPMNLIPNSSLETVSGSKPKDWSGSSWGTNKSVFTYLTTGYSGSRSIKTEITQYSNGSASWSYEPVTVKAGKSYKYENWYKSNVDSEVDVELNMTDGSTQWFYLKLAPKSENWTKFSATFDVPTGAKSMAIYQILAKKGFVTTDDYSLVEYTPQPLNRPIISLSFDDGWRSIFTNGLPLLTKYNLPSTQYLLTETTTYPDYMTVDMMKAFRDKGHEIASHTITHTDLTTLSLTQLTNELSKSQSDLQNWLNVPVKNFASPYGAYNNTVITGIKQFYRSHRSVEEGFNSKDNFDIYDIKVQNITNTTTPSQVQAWINQAVANKTWLVLVYHEVDNNPEDTTYAVTPANLDKELNIIKQSGITALTVNQALDEITAQL